MIKKTKIISTIGPSSNHPHSISRMIKNGMNVARLNMAHLHKEDDLKSIINIIREESSKLNKFTGILMDISGPKIRTDLSSLKEDKINIIKGHVYTLGFSKMNDIPISMDVNFKSNSNSVSSFVKIDDGKISFKIISISNNIVKIKATSDCLIKPNKGVNFPGVELKIPSLTKKDIKDIKLGIKYKIDWFALSFVRSPEDIDGFNEINRGKPKIPIIAKIEKPEAIDNLEKIINKFDGILIARGDLGVELPIYKLPILQKEIISKCKELNKPVIVATQILESMISNPLPTRAEVNDVANSVYENVDAVMLSGETAMGDFPVETVKMMNDIILNVENENLRYERIKFKYKQDAKYAIGKAVNTVSKNLNVDAIVVMTESGSTAKIVSFFRPRISIYALSPHVNVCNRLSLLWGVTPMQSQEYLSTDEMLMNAEQILLNNKFIKRGQTFVMTAGVPVGISGSTNMFRIHKVE
jgi:pyruvate kinase